jgi:hypothetical protein
VAVAVVAALAAVVGVVETEAADWAFRSELLSSTNELDDTIQGGQPFDER